MNEAMRILGERRSAIRELFEYGKRRKAEIGEENVFDFSLGNPCVPPPDTVTRALESVIATSDPTALHGYTSAQGNAEVRIAVAREEEKRAGVPIDPDLIYMTCGAAASLTAALHATVRAGDEVIVFSPYFPEYRVFAEAAGATVREVPCSEGTFEPDLAALSDTISSRTKAVILNSPNNPTGRIVSEQTLRDLGNLLREKEADCDTEIVLISDEPYRELVYTDAPVPFVASFYARTLVCYSYSKSLSLPGERIGYLLVPPTFPDAKGMYAAVCGAGRALGFVCAPSLWQDVISRCAGETSDLSLYRENRRILCDGLREIGYSFAEPEGAFYLFVRALEPDAVAFCERAKEFELLMVPSDGFGMKGYVRIAFCTSRRQIEASLPAFRELYESYRKGEQK